MCYGKSRVGSGWEECAMGRVGRVRGGIGWGMAWKKERRWGGYNEVGGKRWLRCVCGVCWVHRRHLGDNKTWGDNYPVIIHAHYYINYILLGGQHRTENKDPVK